jgi:hypothetical protein
MYSKSLPILVILSTIILMMVGCDKATDPPQVTIPVLTSTAVTGITSSSATSGGNITSDGGAAVTARGVCWSTNSTPTVTDSKTTDGSGTGSFTSTITGLDSNTTYNVRAYATNSAGTGYGSPRTFFTTSANNQLDYLGQTPPGRTIQRFGPGIVSDWFHSEVTISPDKQEIYWTDGTSIYWTKQQNGSWTTPAIVPFSGQGTVYYYDDVPVVSPDNNKLFFLSKRPISYASPNDENIWYVDRIPTGWSEPKPLPQIINSVPGIHWQISVATNGTLYYSAGDKIYYSRFTNGQYINPEPFQAINAFGNLTCPFIAPDESYIIFCKIEQSIGTLYVSFKSTAGLWLQPQILNGIPAPTSFVSRDGKYLFVNRYWISAGVIEDLRPSN